VGENELRYIQLGLFPTSEVDHVCVTGDVRLRRSGEDRLEVRLEGVALNQNALRIVHEESGS
jgi:hypothetical protein